MISFELTGRRQAELSKALFCWGRKSLSMTGRTQVVTSLTNSDDKYRMIYKVANYKQDTLVRKL